MAAAPCWRHRGIGTRAPPWSGLAGLLLVALGTCCSSAAAAAALQPASLHLEAAQQTLNLRPLIGIISQPGSPSPEHTSYIAASYVKFVETAGARAVPIPYDLPAAEVERRFKAINGVLIPGGGANLSPKHPFYDMAAQLVGLAQQANDRGTYFPVHGTCLGFEALAVIAASNASVLGYFDAEDFAAPLYYTERARGSRFFKLMPDWALDALQQRPLAFENHARGVSVRAFEESAGLREGYDILSLSLDRQGEVYVSTLESKRYPMTATQWHPEKNIFEFLGSKRTIPHTPEAVAVARAVADFVVGEARRNSQAPSNAQEEADLLIYNYPLRYTGRQTFPGEEVDFDEIYIFKENGR